MDLAADLRAELLAYLPTPDREARAWLDAMPTAHLAECFFTLRGRLVHPHPRRVHQSGELAARARGAWVGDVVSQVAHLVAGGAELAPLLSRRIGHGYLPGLRKPRDLDVLLNEWNIHYLHLSRLAPDREDAPRHHVLFAMFRDDDAYFLEVLPRDGWSVPRLAEIAAINWPQAGLLHALSDAGMAEAHRISVRGQTYVGNSFGVSEGSHLPHIVAAAMKLLGLVHFFCDQPNCLEQEFAAANRRYGVELPLLPRFQLKIARTARGFEFVVIEPITALMMALGI